MPTRSQQLLTDTGSPRISRSLRGQGVSQAKSLFARLNAHSGSLTWFGSADETAESALARLPEDMTEFLKLLHPDDVEKVPWLRRGPEPDMTPQQFEARVKVADDRWHWWHFSALPEGHGDVTETWLLACIDINATVKLREELARLAHERGERVKELKCLHGLSEMVTKHNLDLDKICRDLPALICRSWQYPEDTCAHVLLNGQSYTSDNFASSPWRLMEDVRCDDEVIGAIEVYYRTKKPLESEGPFLTEEVELLHSITERLGRIYERCRNLNILREREAELSRSQELAGLGSWEYNPETGNFRLSDKARDFFGLWDPVQPASTVLGCMGSKCARDFERMLSTVGDNQSRHRLSCTVRRNSDDRILYVILLAEYDAESKTVSGTIQDVTESKTFERLLCQREEQYRLLAQNTLDMIWVTDMELRFTYVNPAVKTMLGYTVEEFVGTTIRDHCSDEVVAMGEQLIQAALQSPEKQPNVFEAEIRHKDGYPVPIEIHSKILYDDSERPVGVQGVSRDITQRKQADLERERIEAQLQQAQKMEAVGRLAGGIAHDFNNMLNIILGYSVLALEGLDESNELYDDIVEIRNAAQRSAELTGQLLAFSRKQIIKPVVLCLNDVVEQQAKMLARLIGEDITLKIDPASDLWSVRADPSQLDQIIANLVVNARDAISGNGTIVISTDNVDTAAQPISPVRHLSPGRYVRLSVADSGCGISRELQKSIFEPFFTTKEESHGTGLGLSTVFGIVEQNNGAVCVESEPEAGATFHILLPQADSTTLPVGPEPISATTSVLGSTILVVEDEPELLKLVMLLLERQGHESLGASSAAEALKIAGKRADDISLLITDVIMPGMNGKDLEERIRQQIPNLKTIFISGYTSNIIAQKGVLKNDTHFLQKPFSGKSLSQKVSEVLGAVLEHSTGELS